MKLFANSSNTSVSRSTTQNSYLSFSDFIAMMQPRHSLKLSRMIIFEKNATRYHNEYPCSEETISLISQILCLHLSFIDDMSILTQNIMPLELFNQIARGKAFFTADDLFSFLLNLPVIFSTYDAEVICCSF